MLDTVMLFAAGRGTRMAPLTDKIPKPLVPVSGKPLIDHALALAQGAGLSRIFANTHYLPDLMTAHLSKTHVEAIHEPVLLETGGGLKNAVPKLDRPAVITLNSDAVWQGANPISNLMQTWDPDKMDCLMCLIHPENALGHQGPGDFLMAEDGELRRNPGLVYSGLQIIKTPVVAEIEEDTFSLNVVWDRLIANRTLFGMAFAGKWCDVGQPQSIPLAEQLLNV